MIELQRASREGPVSELLGQAWLQPFNGVEGVALSYDERLVAEADRRLRYDQLEGWRGTLEHSRLLALLLAAVSQRFEGARPDREREFPRSIEEDLFRWWVMVTDRAHSRRRSPIVVEVTARRDFGIEARPLPEAMRDLPYRYRIRPSSGARMHSAAAGGRIDGIAPGRPRGYGTIGGFVVDQFSCATFGVTAAHVCWQTAGYARALPLPSAPAPIRNGLCRLLGSVGMERYRREKCPWHWDSPASIVPRGSCTAKATPSTEGIDVALHRVEPQVDLQPVEIAYLSDLSPMLDLSFVGATSGHRRARATSYSIWHNYHLDEVEVCIHDCVQIKLADRPYVRTNLSSRGDSGSWLLARNEHEAYWVGLLTGGDGDVAGIVPAERIINCVERKLNLSLQAYI